MEKLSPELLAKIAMATREGEPRRGFLEGAHATMFLASKRAAQPNKNEQEHNQLVLCVKTAMRLAIEIQKFALERYGMRTRRRVLCDAGQYKIRLFYENRTAFMFEITFGAANNSFTVWWYLPYAPSTSVDVVVASDTEGTLARWEEPVPYTHGLWPALFEQGYLTNA